MITPMHRWAGAKAGVLTGRWCSSGPLRFVSRSHAIGTPESLQPVDSSGAPALSAETVGGASPDAAAASRPAGRRRAARTGTTQASAAAAPELKPEGAEDALPTDAAPGLAIGGTAAEPQPAAARTADGSTEAPAVGTSDDVGPAVQFSPTARRKRRTAVAARSAVTEPAPEAAAATAASASGSSVGPQGRTGRSGGGGGSAGGDAEAAETRVTVAVSAASHSADDAAAAVLPPPLAAAAAGETPQVRRRGRLFPVDQIGGAATVAQSRPRSSEAPDADDSAGGRNVDAGSGGGDGSGGGLDPESFSAARARALRIKTALFRNMRSETMSPSQDSMKLVLEPVTSTREATPQAEPLRAEPLPPRPPPPSPPPPAAAAAPRKRLSDGGGEASGEDWAAARRRRAAETWATLRPGEQRRRLEQQQIMMMRRQGREQERGSGREKGGAGERWGQGGWERGKAPTERGAGGPAEARQRVLRPLAARNLEAAGKGQAASAARAAGFGAAAAGMVGAAAAAGAVAAGERAKAKAAAAQERRDRVRRANEDFAAYIEGVAAAAAKAEGEEEGGRDGGAVRRSGGGYGGGRQPDGTAGRWQQQQQRSMWAGKQQRFGDGEVQRERRGGWVGPEEPQRRQQQQQRWQQEQQKREEQASLLRGLAQMFRSFARREQPAANAAAMVAAVSPAAAVAAAAAAASTVAARGSGGGGPLAGFLGLGRANDVQLILQPLTGKKLAEAEAGVAGRVPDGEDGGGGAAAARGGLRARPLPTRADLLRLMRPVSRARLPPFTRSVGLRVVRNRQPRQLQRLEAAPAEAMELVGDAARVSSAALRALRRRAYFYRQLAPERLEQQRQEQQQQQQRSAEMEAGLDGHEATSQEHGEAAAAAAAVAAAAPPRARLYSLSGRSYNVQRRAQYSDVLKRTVRRASLGRVVTGKIGGGAAAAAAAAAAVGGEAESVLAVPEEAEAEEEPPRGEYNSAAEVVNDVYEEVMGVRLPERAMYGRRAEALAAMSPSAVKEQIRSWIEACGKDFALAFHAREPLLLTVPAASLLLSLEHLNRVFGAPPEECVQLALRNPSFVGLPYEQLQGAVEAVSEALEVGLQEAGKIVLKCPGLAVRQSEFPVARRLELLGALLPVSREKLRQVVRQRPQLLSKSPQSLAAFMMAASSTLGMPLFDVALLIAGCPGITGVSAVRLGSRWEALQRSVAALPQWREQLSAISPPSLGRCLVANEAALARLQVVLDRGLADDTELSSFKKVLTMSATRFETLTRPRARRDRAAAPAAVAVEAAEMEPTAESALGHDTAAVTAAATATAAATVALASVRP
ncbi:hypothetical protein PLESTF_001030500 [Pleodorina starrii]|nr:hypothetical protein PLESTF_001030500 [Pleodorina starrii]